MRGLSGKALARRLAYLEEKRREEERVRQASQQTSTEAARHNNSRQGGSSSNVVKPKGNYSPTNAPQSDGSLRAHANELSSISNRPLYSYRNDSRHTPAVRGMQVLDFDDPRNDGAYYGTGAFIIGAGSVLDGLINARKMNIDIQNQNLAERRRTAPTNTYYTPRGTTPVTQTTQPRRHYEGLGGQLGQKFQNFYDKTQEEYAADPRANTFAGKIAPAAGRLAADIGLMALDPSPVGEIAAIGKLGNSLLRLGSKPGFTGITLGSYTGDRYAEAREAGTDVDTASRAATAYGLGMTALSKFGGAERLIGSGGSRVGAAIKGGLTEGIEEPIQGIWGEGSKALYGVDMPLYAEGKDENGNWNTALINPGRMLEEGLFGTIMGTAGGAITSGIDSHVNTTAYQTGRQLGLSNDVLKQAAAIEKAIKKRIVFEDMDVMVDENGDAYTVHGYAGEDGAIHVNANDNDIVASIISHEMTHFLEQTNSYQYLYETALAYHGDNVENIRNELRQSYDEKDIETELVSRFVERELLTNYNAILRVAKQDPGLIEKMIYWVRDLVRKIGKTDDARLLIDAERKWSRALEEAKRSGSSVDDRRFMFVGQHSRTANAGKLIKAFEMERKGDTNDKIREKTGWWRNPDGEWRYEIDDSKVRLKDFIHNAFPNADALLSFLSGNNKYNSIPSGDIQKLQDMEFKLGEIISHDNLFAAYPELKDITVRFAPISNPGYYDANEKAITISPGQLTDPTGFTKTLLHEVQHAVQDVEGFASGASADGWREADKAVVKRMLAARDRLIETAPVTEAARKKLKEYVALFDQKSKSDSDKSVRDKHDQALVRLYDKYDEEVWFARLNQLNELIYGSAKDRLRYLNTAGEIEAREVEKRLFYNEKDRENVAPTTTGIGDVTLFADSKYSSPFKEIDWWNHQTSGKPVSMWYPNNNDLGHGKKIKKDGEIAGNPSFGEDIAALVDDMLSVRDKNSSSSGSRKYSRERLNPDDLDNLSDDILLDDFALSDSDIDISESDFDKRIDNLLGTGWLRNYGNAPDDVNSHQNLDTPSLPTKQDWDNEKASHSSNKGKTATISPDRLNKMFPAAQGIKKGDDFAAGYITRINPTDFLYLTTPHPDAIRQESRSIDWDEFSRNSQTPYLRIDGFGNVVGHEGRHRIAALEADGYDYVEVWLKPQNDYGGYYHKEPVVELRGQYNQDRSTIVENVIPLSVKYRSEIEATYGNGKNTRKYSREKIGKVPVATEDQNGTELRGHARNAADVAEATGNPKLADSINDNPVNKKGVFTDAQAQEEAWRSFDGKTLTEAANDFVAESAEASGLLHGDRLKTIATKGIDIYIEAVNSGNEALAARMVASNSVLGTELGRGVQAYSQLKKLSPEGKVLHLQTVLRQQAKKKAGYDGVEIGTSVDNEVNKKIPDIINGFADDLDNTPSRPKERSGKRGRLLDNIEKKRDTQGSDTDDSSVDDDVILDNEPSTKRKRTGKKKKKTDSSKKTSGSSLADAVQKRIDARRESDSESVRQVQGDIDDAVTELKDLVDRYIRQTDIAIPKDGANQPPRYTEDIRKALENIDSYEGTYNDAVSELRVRYADDEEALSLINTIFGDEYKPIINRKMLRQEVRDTLNDMGIDIDDLAKSFYSEGSLAEIISNRVAGNVKASPEAIAQLEEDIKNDIIDEMKRRGQSEVDRRLRPKNNGRNGTLAQQLGEFGARGGLDTSSGRDYVAGRTFDKDNTDRSAVDDVSYVVNMEYYNTQREMIRNQLLERYAGNQAAIDTINDSFDYIAANEVGIKVAKRIVSEGLKNGDLDFREAANTGNIPEVTQQILEYVLEKSNYSFGEKEVIGITAAITDDLNARVRDYRDNVLKSLDSKKFSKNASKFVQELIKFNNLGAFDDPEMAEMVYRYLDAPYIDADTLYRIQKLSELSHKLAQNPEEVTETDFLGDEIAAVYQDEFEVLEKKLAEGNTDYVIDALDKLAEKSALDVLKSSNWAKVRQYQITSMLFNLKTMNRNIVPNVGMAGLNTLSDAVGTLMDKGLANDTGVRTKGISNAKTMYRGAKKGVSEAMSDYKLGIDTSSGNTADLVRKRHFEGSNAASRAVNRATDLVSLGLQLGDRPFEQAYYESSLENLMKLNGVDEPSQWMIDYAKSEALVRTFKDDNMLTESVQKFVSILNGGREYGVGSAIIPFVRTPVNLLITSYRYSPLGAISVAKDVYDFKTATDEESTIMAQAKLVNDLSKTVTGTIIGIVAATLKTLGLIEIYGGEEEEEESDSRNKYNKNVHGFQPYSIRIGDKYYNYGNLQPIGSIIASAVDARDTLEDGTNAAEIAQSIVDCLGSQVDLVCEQSFFKSLSDFFGSDSESISGSVIQTMLNALTQFVPAPVQQTARVVDPYKRNTRGQNDVQTAVNKVLSNIPGLSYTLPKQVDNYGNPIERNDGGVVSDIFNSFINPVTVTKYKETAVTNEVERLEDTTGELLIPGSVGSSIDYGNETVKLTAREQSDLNAKIGGDINSALGELFATEAYANLSETEKAKAVKTIRDSITNYYKAELLNDKGYDKTITNKQAAMMESPEHGLSVAEFAMHDAVLSAMDDRVYADDLAKSSAKRIYILNAGLTTEGQIHMIMSEGLFDSEKHLTNMRDAENFGISNNDYILAFTAAKAYESMTDNFDDRLVDTASYIYNMENLNEEQKSILFGMVFNPYRMTRDNSVVDFSKGDLDSIIVGAQGKKFQEVWNGENKYINYDVRALGYSASDFLAMYNWANGNTAGSSKADFEATVNRIDAPANVKQALVAMRGFKPSGGYSNGGSVSLDDINSKYSATATPWEDVVSSVMTTNAESINELRTDDEKARIQSINEIREWSNRSGIVNPVAYDEQYVTGEFGEDRGDHTHAGIDIAVNGKGDIPALSVTDGEVVFAGQRGGYGNTVIVRNSDGYYALYGHLDSFADLEEGDKISAGQQIGIVGSTGTSSGNHLHFEVRQGSMHGNPVDPNSVYDLDGDGVLLNGNKQSMGTGSADPNYTPSPRSYSGSSSGGSSGGGGGGRRGTISTSVSSRSRYGYSAGGSSGVTIANSVRRRVR